MCINNEKVNILKCDKLPIYEPVLIYGHVLPDDKDTFWKMRH